MGKINVIILYDNEGVFVSEICSKILDYYYNIMSWVILKSEDHFKILRVEEIGCRLIIIICGREQKENKLQILK